VGALPASGSFDSCWHDPVPPFRDEALRQDQVVLCFESVAGPYRTGPDAGRSGAGDGDYGFRAIGAADELWSAGVRQILRYPHARPASSNSGRMRNGRLTT
jgi:hypothetical protein